jgi:hypothetical protein
MAASRGGAGKSAVVLAAATIGFGLLGAAATVAYVARESNKKIGAAIPRAPLRKAHTRLKIYVCVL